MENPIFFKKEFAPKYLSELSFNNDLTEKLKKFSTTQIPFHIIINGPQGSGKKTRALALINHLNNNDNKVFRVKFKEETMDKSNFIYGESIYHIELTPTSFGIDDKNILATYINERASHERYFTQDQNIIIIHNAENVSMTAYQALRVIMEKQIKNTKIIFLTSGLSRIPDAIKSRCILLRCPSPSKIETSNLIIEMSKKAKFKISKQAITKIIDNSCSYMTYINLNKVFYILQMSYLNFNKYSNFNFPTDSLLEKLFKLISTNPSKITNKLITELRTCIYDLILTNIEIVDIYHYILNRFMKSVIHTDDQKVEITQIIIDSESAFRKGNKAPIYLESMIFNLMNLLNK